MEQREEALKAEQDSLKDAQKAGKSYGSATTPGNQSTSTENKTVEDQSSGNQPSEGKTEEKVSNNPRNKPEEEKISNNPRNNSEEEETLKFYTAEELTQLSVMNIKKLKLDYNTKITNRKVGLKTKSSIWKPEKIEKTKAELAELEKQIVLFDAELAKRKESE